MATFPTYAKILLPEYGEEDSGIVERTQMDRGMPKQRRTQSDVIVALPMRVLFKSAADAESFRLWYYSSSGAAAGTAYFDFTDPRTGAIRQARVVANTLGKLTPGAPYYAHSTRSLTIEYLQSL